VAPTSQPESPNAGAARRSSLGPGRLLLIAWLVLLATSHLWRATHPPAEPELGPRAEALELPVHGGDPGAVQRVVIEQLGPTDPAARAVAPAVLCAHGSPGARRDWRQVAEAHRERYRFILVDLPGFGDSTRSLPDYSFLGHAHTLVALADALELDEVHLAGFSMGGGVVLHAAELLGERTRSVALVSAISVQELEWLGNYTMNHAVHGLQVAAFWLRSELLPHFGAFDHGFFGIEYARNFYDSDQRPLRGILEAFEGPLFIYHGAEDFLAPVDVAEEGARIAPQAELVISDQSHFDIFQRGNNPVAAAYGPFLDAVESGDARTRADATPAELARAAEPFDPAGAPYQGMVLIFIGVMLALSTLVSEDLTCIGAGALVAQGRLPLWVGSLGCLAGIVVGDLIIYWLGRRYGTRLLAWKPMAAWIPPAKVERAARWFERRGFTAVILTRFMPGMRVATYFSAGALKTHAGLFALYFAAAAAVWTPLLVWGSSLLGGELVENFALFEKYLPLAFVFTILLGLTVVKLVVPMFTWGGRRRLSAKFARARRFEFAPPWLVYPPVVLYTAWLGLRTKGWATCCAANPAIPGGGFVGESKAAILAGLDGAAPPAVASLEELQGLDLPVSGGGTFDERGNGVGAWLLLRAGESAEVRLGRIEAWLAGVGLDWPLVIKPDSGQRGSGVLMAETAGGAADYLVQEHLDLLVQQPLEGPEFGVFWERRPGEPRGRVTSITTKELVRVTGDGVSTLERLILTHPRARLTSQYFLEKHTAELDEVPPRGVVLPLGSLGTHARGAVFRNGNHLATEALAASLDRLLEPYEGFCFGRFDLKAASPEDLSAGRDLRIIELNGITAERTHIYDPGGGWWAGWSELCAQWKACFRIGADNAARGAHVPRWWSVLLEFPRYRKRQKGHRGG
jgi:membrane protein DedA with SNARE-associated domain/pimeloyl-ACP methyl ester carboxylesterase